VQQSESFIGNQIAQVTLKARLSSKSDEATQSRDTFYRQILLNMGKEGVAQAGLMLQGKGNQRPLVRLGIALRASLDLENNLERVAQLLLPRNKLANAQHVGQEGVEMEGGLCGRGCSLCS
jgi:hypothetical protein